MFQPEQYKGVISGKSLLLVDHEPYRVIPQYFCWVQHVQALSAKILRNFLINSSWLTNKGIFLGSMISIYQLIIMIGSLRSQSELFSVMNLEHYRQQQVAICHATSNSFYVSSVQTKDIMSVKNCWMLPQRWKKQICFDSLYSGEMRVKLKRESDGTFFLYDVYSDRAKKVHLTSQEWILLVYMYVLNASLKKSYRSS